MKVANYSDLNKISFSLQRLVSLLLQPPDYVVSKLGFHYSRDLSFL